MIRLIEEIKRIELDNDPILDEKCIGLYNTMVVFLKTKYDELKQNYNLGLITQHDYYESIRDIERILNDRIEPGLIEKINNLKYEKMRLEEELSKYHFND